jgi:hypothetical protein
MLYPAVHFCPPFADVSSLVSCHVSQAKAKAKVEVTPVPPPVAQTTPPTPLKRPIDNLVNGNLNLSSNLLKNMGSLVPGGDKQQRPWIDPMARLSGSGIRFVQPDLLVRLNFFRSCET